MSYEAEVLADLPLLYWRLGESSGTVAADTSGNGHTGTYTNGPTLGTAGLLPSDAANTAVTFDGVNDSVRSAALTGTYSTWSIEALIHLTDYGVGPIICGFADDTIEITVATDGHAELLAGANFIDSTAGAIALNTTYHLAGTCDGATGRLYINGAQVASGTMTGESVAAVQFWAGDDNFSDPFTGVIDEVAFYTTALSANRVLAHYSAVGHVNTYTPPIVYDMGPILPDTQGLQRLLFRHYPAHGRFEIVWKLATTPPTYTLAQPYPLITPQDVAQGNMPIGQTYTQATYTHVYYGPEQVDDAEAARLLASGIGTVT